MDRHDMFLRSLRLLAHLALACSLLSCTALLEKGSMFGTPPGEEAKAPTMENLPTIIAIMPFQNQTEVKGAGERLRKEFYNLFSSEPYVDIEPSVIDEKMVRLEKDSGQKIFDLKPAAVCQAMGCDGLIFGTVTSYEKIYTGIYSQLSAAAEVWLVDAKTGKEIARVKKSVNYLAGDIPLSPLGAIMTALSTAANVREIQEVRMINELAYKLIKQIPEPQGTPEIRRPQIRAVISNVSDVPFGRGNILKVGLYGEPGIVAAFDIGNFKQGIPMKETQPGVYMGEYAVLPGDDTSDMPVIAYLRRPSGPESQWIYTGGLITIDTSAPPKVSNLQVRSFTDRIEISWEYSPDVSDLSGFLVLRSVQPLSGFEKLAKVELNAFADRQVKPGGLYYYRIVAVDRAGNRSEFSATTAAQVGMVEEEPEILLGKVSSDRILSGTFLLKGQLTVPAGVTLTIGSGCVIMAERGAGILVQGKLVIDGQKGQARLFSRRGEKWAGIAVKGGQAELKNFLLSGSVAGVTLIETDAVVENAEITGNDTGVSLSGATPMVIRNCWVASNGTGIELVGTAAKVLKSVVVGNGTGLSLKYFSGEVRDNIILDNEKNILSDAPLKLAPNYLGRAPTPRLPPPV